jgi:hypothetical protein
MYELKKKIGKVFTRKFAGTGPSSYGKKNLPGRGLTKVEKHWSKVPNPGHDLCFSNELKKKKKDLY